VASQATSITAHVIGGAVEMVCEMKKYSNSIPEINKKMIKILRVTAA
jgi:hypothetical protein